MELSVLIEPTGTGGFRAAIGEPLAAVAEGTTRDEALANLRAALVARVAAGAEVVRIQLDVPASRLPVWPDDDLTAAWLQGIADARAAADARPDPWDAP